VTHRHRYRFADTAQQFVGGVLLAIPFVVTEEVWVLAASMGPAHTGGVFTLVVLIGYGTLYKADASRNPEDEVDVGGVPIRFISLLTVALGATVVLATLITAPQTFLIDGEVLDKPTRLQYAYTVLNAVGIASVSSIVGAATADSLF
jgi:Predicted membrane protein